MNSPSSDPSRGQVRAKASSTITQKSEEDEALEEGDVIDLEKIEIAAQRTLRGMENSIKAPPVGLALSGGGIRSATFSLGALQTLSRLHLPVSKENKQPPPEKVDKADKAEAEPPSNESRRKPLVEFIDYLSTVSGGGYIGSWFVANRKREMKTKKRPGTSFATTSSSGEDCDSCEEATEPVAHLRRYSHYLMPESGLMSGDTWTMAMIWLRNTALIQAMVFLAIGCCFMLPHLWLRVVNGIYWVLMLIDPAPGTELPLFKDGTMIVRLFEIVFPVGAFLLLLSAYKQAKIEISLYAKDREMDKKGTTVGTIDPIDQSHVQKRIVLPAVGAALLVTLWLRLHHILVHLQEKPSVPLTPQPEQGWIERMAAAVQSWWCGWWGGVETTSMLASPLMLVFTFSVLLLAHKLMWLREDLEKKKQRKRKQEQQEQGQKPQQKTAAAKSLRLRRALYYFTLVAGSLFSLYLIDEIFCRMHEFMVSFGEKTQGVELGMNTAHGKMHASFTTETPGREFDIGMGLTATLGPALMVLKFLFMLVLALGMAGRRMHDNVREWWSRVGAWLMIYSLAIFAVCGIALFGPIVFDWVGNHWSGWMKGGVITGWLATLFGTLFVGKSEKSTGEGKKPPLLNLDNAALIVLLGMLLMTAWLVRFLLTPAEYTTPGSDPLLLGTLNLGYYYGWLRFFGVLAGLMLAGAALVWRVDLNEFSMNHFYRNRLVRCYLGGATWGKNERRPHPFTGFEFRDDQPLANFTAEKHASKGHPGPYPLINAALNTSQGGDLDVQERKAESFLLSPLFCGSSRKRLSVSDKELPSVCQGYRPTQQFMSGAEPPKKGKDAPQDTHSEQESDADTHGEGIKLGTAMSISGAAASPNSGYHTAPVMAFLMTLFNVRLGWWAPNPAKTEWWKQAPDFGYPEKTDSAPATGTKGKKSLKLPKLGFLQYLAYELFGSATPNSAFVYLSDGGHFENLGIYELVRRKCMFIIAIDGEEDGDFTFHALGTAIRRCRVDFDAEIEIGVNEIRPDPATGLSGSHCAVGKIHYPGGTGTGTLLYIKTALTGDETTDIAQYKKMSPAFPHESTGDQFFSESQFESYRKLGQHAMLEALAPLRRPAMRQGKPDDPTQPLRLELEQHWYRAAKAPNESFINHTERLDEIWASLAEDDLPECISDIVLPRKPGIPQKGWPDEAKDAQDTHKIICFGQRLIQLMENVCLDLQLSAQSSHPDHTGWVHLFKGWAQHEVLNDIWKDSKDTYGTRFANFWEDLRPSEPAVRKPKKKGSKPVT